jgi:hypothetical protein
MRQSCVCQINEANSKLIEELTHIPPLNLSDTDTIFPNISTHQHSALNMNKLTKCREFNGYPQDNAKQFLAEFES